MLAAINGLDFAPVAEQEPAYVEQAEIAVGIERDDTIECLQVPMAGEATEPFFRPNPLGASSVSAGSLGEDMEGQGTNSAAYVRYDAFVQYDVEGQGTNSIVKRIDKLAEEITYGGPQPSQLDGLHGWKVEKVSPDTIDPLTEDSWKVEEVSADVIDLLAGDRSSMISPGETFQAMTLPANAPPTEE